MPLKPLFQQPACPFSISGDTAYDIVENIVRDILDGDICLFTEK